MQEQYKIEKDIYLKCWIVWEAHKNYSIDRFHAKKKRECKEWLSTLLKNI